MFKTLPNTIRSGRNTSIQVVIRKNQESCFSKQDSTSKLDSNVTLLFGDVDVIFYNNDIDSEHTTFTHPYMLACERKAELCL